jgi:hypothetical protein
MKIQRIEKRELINNLINMILKKVSELADTIVKESIEYCKDYAKRLDNEYILDLCLWRMKNQAREELVEYTRELLYYFNRLYGNIGLTQEERDTFNRRLQEIVDTALYKIYPHEIHPML